MADLAEHFESLPQQQHAARFGMWVFLGSEALLFLGLFALYVSYRVEYPTGFGEGVEHNTLVYGSVNTFVLLCSSYSVAAGLHALRHGSRAASVLLVALTVLLGGVFLVIKIVEYIHHFHEGIYPGGTGTFFHEHKDRGTILFFTLYFVTTGLHALHVTVGMIVLAFMGFRVYARTITSENPYVLELGAIYWHLVDLIWIFLWPLYYLIPGGASR